jgi:hypothetical protein
LSVCCCDVDVTQVFLFVFRGWRGRWRRKWNWRWRWKSRRKNKKKKKGRWWWWWWWCDDDGGATRAAKGRRRRRTKSQWVFLGCPGVDKGTYAIRLSKLLQVPHIAMGNLVRQELSKSSSMAKQVCCKCSSFISSCFSTHPPTHPLLLFLLTEESLLGFVFIVEMQKHHSLCFPSPIFFSLNCLSACLLAWVGACLFVVCTQNLTF